ADRITFRHLMTHTSGLNEPGSASDYRFMKANIAKGVTGVGTYHYQNQNFGLCRILIATLNGNVSPAQTFALPLVPDANDRFWDYTTIRAYGAYVRTRVFAPAGVPGPTMDHRSSDALAYTFPVNRSSWNSGDLSTMIGAVGWHMSADELRSVMSAFRRGGTIMSPSQAQTVLDSGFGIDGTASTPLGTLYYKSGVWGNGHGHQEQSLAYFLPQDGELVVLVNSPMGSPASCLRNVVTNLYISHVKAG
ncbi:MAG TPA: serine hydrolase, partial [Candidatus Methylomirabilis sp.]|nr:serine hydrolase [Candidatus Methylomirabilis sp.]